MRSTVAEIFGEDITNRRINLLLVNLMTLQHLPKLPTIKKPEHSGYCT
jgi:hypothetical protein